MKDNASFNILRLLIKQLDIPVTKNSIIDELQKHQHASTLRALSDILDNWNIPNAAYPATLEELLETEIPTPFIACLQKGELALVNQINGEWVTVSNKNWNNQQLDIHDFKNYYQGTILAFQKDTSSGEPDYSAKRRKEIANRLRVPFIVSCLIIILITFLTSNQSYPYALSWNMGLLIFFKTIGLAVSVLLLIQSVDSDNPLIHKFCGSDDNKNCNAILTSKAAKVTEELSWSEVGFFYFAGTLLAFFFNADKNNVIQLLALLNLISLPYTFYSIYYQWRVAKQWCVFCCSVQALLWFEFFAFLPYLSNGIHLPNSAQWSNLLIVILIPILLWVFLKPYLLSSKQVKLLRSELYRFKYNKELFQNMLHNEVKYTLLPEEDAIIMGNREADNVITLVSNPFCVHCSKMHKHFDALLEVRNDIKLQLIFIARKRTRETDKKIMEHFMSLESGKNEIKLREAINDWYKQDKKNYEAWKNKYPIKEMAVGFEMLSKQKEWCSLVNITGTPTLFINGRRLPSAYQPEDIQFIL